jgi:cell division protein FtsB
MTMAEQHAFLDQMAQRRAEIQGEINELNRQRQAYIAEQIKNNARPADNSFDFAMLNAIREQARQKNFAFSDGKN